MTAAEVSPLFSVIMPTRNRSELLATALRSVLDQTFKNLEILVVDDGSSEAHMSRYQELLHTIPVPHRLLRLVPTPRGHGPAYATNFGVDHAQGKYFCFLDDDDQWVDIQHLDRVANVLERSTEQVDLILANQRGFRNGMAVDYPIWLEDFVDRLSGTPDDTGAYAVTAAELLGCRSFCHLNTTIISQRLYVELGGFDEGLRFEQDRDFYLRAIDRAQLIRFLPNIISRHNIPDPTLAANVSTTESELSKRLYQLRVLDKAILFSTRPEVRHYAMRHRVYVLEYISREAGRAGRPETARYYGREALAAKLAMAWNRLFRRGSGCTS
jgi:glycosyltransferase involved in cell wall biosynthesis